MNINDGTQQGMILCSVESVIFIVWLYSQPFALYGFLAILIYACLVYLFPRLIYLLITAAAAAWCYLANTILNLMPWGISDFIHIVVIMIVFMWLFTYHLCLTSIIQRN